MATKPSLCVGCDLFGSGHGYVPANGAGANGILLVGEAAGETEERLGLPFVGAAGFYLDRVLKRAGLDRNSFRVHNVLSCRPPNNWLSGAPYEAAAIQHCARYLDKTIQDMRPKAIVALGNVALRRLTGYDGIQRYRGRVCETVYGPVIPTYHPSFLLPRKGQANTSRFVGAVIRDLRLAQRVSLDGFDRMPTRYLEDPGPDEFFHWVLEYLRDSSRPLSVDIETPIKLKNVHEDDLTDDSDEPVASLDERLPDQILRVSFSYVPGHAVSVPWQPAWLPHIARLLKTESPKIVWNGARFDVPVIRKLGLEINGAIHDYMWGWHVLQSDLPKGLEFVSSFFSDLMPWKHESDSRPAWYNAVDADAALRCAIGIQQELQRLGQWDLFQRHVVELDPLLLEMGAVGVHVDTARQARLKTILAEREAALVAEAQGVVPVEVCPTKTIKTKHCGQCGAVISNKAVHQKGGKKNPCHGAPTTITVEHLPLAFNPNSVQHLTAYALHHRHPLGTHFKTKRATLDKKHVEKLATRFPSHRIYRIALDLRGVKKTLGTYVEGFAPDSAGLIHTTYTHAASTGRLTSRNVNLQNVSHRSGVLFADEVRRTIIPKPGHLFVEADSSAIEAVMTGYFMGSVEYVALAKRGIHDYLTCLEFRIPFTPDAIATFKTAHPELYQAARSRNKQVVHGTSYGMGPHLMHMNYPDVFATVAVAEAAQQRFFAACPDLKQWQHETRQFAHKQSYLVNPWGWRHYFYHVFSRDRDGTVTLAEDAKRCVAYLPQSSAAAFMKDNCLLLSKTAFWPLPANGLVHDSYCLEVRPELVDRAVEVLGEILTRPIAELGGLQVGCEIKVCEALEPPNWQDMRVVKKLAA